MVDSFIRELKRFADFNGRTNRRDYWIFILINILLAVAAFMLDIVFGTRIKSTSMVDSFEITEEYKYGYIYVIYTLVMLIPAISIQVRRLHDIGKSGFPFLMVLIITAGFKWFEYQYSEPYNSNNYIYDIIPVVGIIWLVYLYCKAGTPEQNKYDVLAQEAEKTQHNISAKE